MAIINQLGNNLVDKTGGSPLSIYGSGFTKATEVYFIDGTQKKVPARSFQVVSDSEISLVCPAFSSNMFVHVFVTASDGTTATLASKRTLGPNVDDVNLVYLNDLRGTGISDTIPA